MAFSAFMEGRKEELFKFIFLMSINKLSPFSAHAPTSFEGPFGKVMYRIRAVIDTPRFSKDYKCQRPFYLLSVLNLNELLDIEVKALCTSLLIVCTAVTFLIYLQIRSAFYMTHVWLSIFIGLHKYSPPFNLPVDF